MTNDKKQMSLLGIARLTMRVSSRHVAAYSCVKSRKDFTQPQLLTCLVLRALTKSTYREVWELLHLSPTLREAIGLEKVPHWTTLQKLMNKPDVGVIVGVMIGAVLQEAGLADLPADIAVDSTGLESGVASLHYRTRRWETGGGKARKTVKVSVAVLCGVLLPAALVVDLGSSADMKQMPSLLAQIESNATPGRLLADSGYDAEWVHEKCREEWDAESWIEPVIRTADGSIKTRWRSLMRELPRAYGRRWHVESFFSGLKRTTLATLSSRKANTLIAEASIKVLAYALRR